MNKPLEAFYIRMKDSQSNYSYWSKHGIFVDNEKSKKIYTNVGHVKNALHVAMNYLKNGSKIEVVCLIAQEHMTYDIHFKSDIKNIVSIKEILEHKDE